MDETTKARSLHVGDMMLIITPRNLTALRYGTPNSIVNRLHRTVDSLALLQSHDMSGIARPLIRS
jgi:hypothetical protein